jgi:hypothetical protein
MFQTTGMIRKDQLEWEHDWGAGIIGQVVARWLTAREGILANFMGPNTGTWKRTLVTGTFVALSGLAIALFFPAGYLWAGVIVAVCGVLWGLPLFGGTWSGFALVCFYTTVTHLHAVYPIGYGETMRMMLKINMIRIVARVPHAVVSGGVLGYCLGVNSLEGALYGVVALLTVLVLQPIFLAIKFLNIPVSSQHVSGKALVYALYTIASIVVSVSGGVCLVFVPMPYAFLGLPCMVVAALIYCWFSGFLYNRCRVDQVRPNVPQ